jgi:hypothetical protein
MVFRESSKNRRDRSMTLKGDGFKSDIARHLTNCFMHIAILSAVQFDFMSE